MKTSVNKLTVGHNLMWESHAYCFRSIEQLFCIVSKKQNEDLAPNLMNIN